MTTMRTSLQRNMKGWIQPFLLCFALLALWQLMVTGRVWDSTIVPSPIRTVAAAWEFRTVLARDFVVTSAEVSLGFLVTVSASLTAAIMLHLLKGRLRGFYGLLIVLQSVPLWAIAPVLFYWTGPGLTTRLLVIVLTAFFPVLVNTVEGLRRIDQELSDVFDSMNAGVWQKLYRLEIPSVLYMVLAGSQVTLTMCLIGAVLAEMLVGDMVGLGYRIKAANAHFRIDLVFASVALLGVIVALFYSGLALLARRFDPSSSTKES